MRWSVAGSTVYHFDDRTWTGIGSHCLGSDDLGDGPSQVRRSVNLSVASYPGVALLFPLRSERQSVASPTDKIEVVIATALLGSSDDSSKDQELDINHMYFDVVGGAKKWCVYRLGSQASTLYKDQNSVNSANLVSDHVSKKRIKILEKEVSQMRENQERVLQECVEAKVQQRVEEEVSRLRQQSNDRFKSMEEQGSHMMSDMALSSRSFSNPTLPNRVSSNA
ncbi:hypothetical protein BC332_08041 [Capsicum chinense]|nr:hypothetical protein BC332_08041 [Capsicum chinense]